jgi:hypothetical protein
MASPDCSLRADPAGPEKPETWGISARVHTVDGRPRIRVCKKFLSVSRLPTVFGRRRGGVRLVAGSTRPSRSAATYLRRPMIGDRDRTVATNRRADGYVSRAATGGDNVFRLDASAPAALDSKSESPMRRCHLRACEPRYLVHHLMRIERLSEIGTEACGQRHVTQVLNAV